MNSALVLRSSLLSTLLLGLAACGSEAADDDEVGDSSETETTSETGTSESTDTTTEDTDTTETTDETDTSETTEETDTTEETETEETGPGVFTLTSPAFVEGGAIPAAHSCYGANVSPQLDWVDAPAEAQSFAVFFTDLSINFRHSAIWNIPVDLSGLPEDVDKDPMPADVPGAVQGPSYAGWNGYAGPCPGTPHTYQFTLYALDVASVAELDSNSSLAEVEAALEAHAIAEATLSGEFSPP